MKDLTKIGGRKKKRKKKENVLPELARFGEFTELMKQLSLEGTKNDPEARAHKETANLIPEPPGNERHIYFVFEDLVKKIIRFRNQRGEKDLVKLALSAYLLWMKLYKKKT